VVSMSIKVEVETNMEKIQRKKHFIIILLWIFISLPFLAIVIGMGGGLHVLTISHLIENVRKEGLNDVIIIYGADIDSVTWIT
jgi:hypothetical protein